MSTGSTHLFSLLTFALLGLRQGAEAPDIVEARSAWQDGPSPRGLASEHSQVFTSLHKKAGSHQADLVSVLLRTSKR